VHNTNKTKTHNEPTPPRGVKAQYQEGEGQQMITPERAPVKTELPQLVRASLRLAVKASLRLAVKAEKRRRKELEEERKRLEEKQQLASKKVQPKRQKRARRPVPTLKPKRQMRVGRPELVAVCTGCGAGQAGFWCKGCQLTCHTCVQKHEEHNGDGNKCQFKPVPMMDGFTTAHELTGRKAATNQFGDMAIGTVRGYYHNHRWVKIQYEDGDGEDYFVPKALELIGNFDRLFGEPDGHSRKPFVCGECDKAFRVSSTLRTHERVHSGEKPFVCGECGKGFKQRGTLRNHKRVHSGSEP